MPTAGGEPGKPEQVPALVTFQALAPLPEFDGNYPVIGAWIVAGRSCGIGIREDDSPITKNTSRFIPHVISAA